MFRLPRLSSLKVEVGTYSHFIILLLSIFQMILSFRIIVCIFNFSSFTLAVVKRKPYSPFGTNQSSWGEYAVARLDDLLNWGRKVHFSHLRLHSSITYFYCLIHFIYLLELYVATHIWLGLLRCGNDAHCRSSIRHGSIWCCVPSFTSTS